MASIKNPGSFTTKTRGEGSGQLLREGLKKTEESVTTFRLGLPPPPLWPELGEQIFGRFFFIPYNLAKQEKYFSPFALF